MDLREYFGDLHAKEAELEKKFPEGVVHVTSLFHRERNSTPGSTLSATCRNAARVITDGTHREATQGEIEGFALHQQDQLRRNTAAEQANKKQYIVVVDQKESAEPVFAGGVEAGRPATGRGKLPSGKVAEV
jgi:hypothetical protein